MKKILIVDDMIVSLMMTENMLADQYETFTALSGQEAIEIYRQEKPDMVLSDLRMPGMTGYELQQTLQQEYHQVIPFMFMTADHTEETESQGFDNGAMDFIRKPFKPDVLLRRVANIMQTVEQIKGLKKNAETDLLTGLLNKASSEKELTAICKNSTGALMMIDLDSFKLVNDIHGHAMGDKVLVTFADILRTSVRSSDLLGRMGGDEFIAFCYGVHEDSAVAQKAKFINERITEEAKKLMGEDMNIPLGASIGCVLVPMSGTDFPDLYKKADKALYIVKQNGKHGYSIYSDDDERENETVSIASIAQVEMILNERNQEAGAFIISFENFRAIYRFLKRTRGFYSKSTCLLGFSLKRRADNRKISSAQALDNLMEVLQKTFRQGDVITRNGSNQILVLLTNTDAHHDVSSAVSRVNKSWEENAASQIFGFNYEWIVMDK
ncbi:MAG: diguanylate cyclase [Selenomonadaceae bacterium]|nr:diguanylate cyclase [Selenomonadaceae bacterium]